MGPGGVLMCGCAAVLRCWRRRLLVFHARAQGLSRVTLRLCIAWAEVRLLVEKPTPRVEAGGVDEPWWEVPWEVRYGLPGTRFPSFFHRT